MRARVCVFVCVFVCVCACVLWSVSEYVRVCLRVGARAHVPVRVRASITDLPPLASRASLSSETIPANVGPVPWVSPS